MTHRVFAMKFSSVYPLYVQKAGKKGRRGTTEEVDPDLEEFDEEDIEGDDDEDDDGTLIEEDEDDDDLSDIVDEPTKDDL